MADLPTAMLSWAWFAATEASWVAAVVVPPSVRFVNNALGLCLFVAFTLLSHAWIHRCYVVGTLLAPYFLDLEFEAERIDAQIAWDPVFTSFLASLREPRDVWARCYDLGRVGRRLRQCGYVPVIQIVLDVHRLTLFTPPPSRRREERAFMIKHATVTLSNAWHPDHRLKKKRRLRDLVKGARPALARTVSKMPSMKSPKNGSPKPPARSPPKATPKRRSDPSAPTTPTRTLRSASEPVAKFFAGGRRHVTGYLTPSKTPGAEPQTAPPAADASPALEPASSRFLTIHVDLTDLIVNVVAYDAKFKTTNLKRVIGALTGEEEVEDEEPVGDEDDDGEGLVGFEKATIADVHVNLYGVRSRDRKQKRISKAFSTTYDGVLSKLASSAQPKNLKHPGGKDHAFQYDYRPLLALTMSQATVAPRVFQSRRGLGLFLERVIVKALASTGLDGVNGAFRYAASSAEHAIGHTLGSVDMLADKLGGPGKHVIQGTTGVAGAGPRRARGGQALLGGVADAARYVPGVGHVVGGVAESTGHVVAGARLSGPRVVAGVVGGLGVAGRHVAKGDLKGAIVEGSVTLGSGFRDAGDELSSNLHSAANDVADGLKDGYKASKRLTIEASRTLTGAASPLLGTPSKKLNRIVSGQPTEEQRRRRGRGGAGGAATTTRKKKKRGLSRFFACNSARKDPATKQLDLD
ncbi:hypothetical protein JL722_5052 [Aureococcus anophagefferens]|nr:hypothetical protein JL722_5052 [Aureococcus anophagefferens]